VNTEDSGEGNECLNRTSTVMKLQTHTEVRQMCPVTLTRKFQDEEMRPPCTSIAETPAGWALYRGTSVTYLHGAFEGLSISSVEEGDLS
jgi:hypothetical protein